MSELVRQGAIPLSGGLLHHARRDSIRILLTIAFRNLLASPVRTAILGAIILVGSLIVVVGTSVLDSIDRGMRTSIQGSLGGQLQIYDGRSEDQLALYGDMTGESRLEPIDDFSRIKEAVAGVPNVKQVVPMGIDQAMVATGNAFDLATERLRNDVRRMEGGERSAELDRSYRVHLAHVRHMCELLSAQLNQARVVAELSGREHDERVKERRDLDRATDPEFWAAFDRDRYANLEFLENRIAPLVLDGGFTFLRYVGTDPKAFFEAFPLAQVSKGEMIPEGKRGILVGEQYADEWLKVKNARRLDQIRDMRDRRGKKIAKDEELQRWVRENGAGLREIMLQLDPVKSDEVAAELRKGLRAGEGEDLEKLLQRLFATTDQDFDEKYELFYRVIAPRIRLYQVNVGETITIKAPSKSGYFSSVNVKVYGFLRFKGIERSGIAGMMSVLDIHSFRDLYGYLTPEKREEIDRMKAQLGAREIAREDAEAALFGGGGGEIVGQARPERIDEKALVGGRVFQEPEALRDRVYTRDDVEHGVALNAAVILADQRARKVRETAEAVRRALDAAGLGYREVKGADGEVSRSGARVIDWQTASGIVGQFVTLIRVVLFAAVVIFFAIALVIINNAMVMATLQRVKEIGTMRAIGTQRRFVVVMLLVEIATVGLVFGLGGALLGGGVVGLIRLLGGIPATTDMLYFVFSGPALFPRLGALAVGTSLTIVLLVAILSSLYPALLAMRVTPVEAMATED
jgi:ABC-type lipoprotein release transport system permease subunit